MHYHAEVWIKDTENLENKLSDILAPYCKEINGEYNQDGFWDWYQIGGRWTGIHDDYDPANDPANIETCAICNGTGFRMDGIARATREKEPSYTCNGCGTRDKNNKWTHKQYGPGNKLKWPYRS